MASQVFYRKWRPQTLAEVVGQEQVTKTLSHALAKGSVSHAYLFCGPRGTGKTSTGRILAKAVHCLTTSASNALLKPLEEPPPHAIFILATTEAHKILSTIMSRCQRFDFRRLSQSAVIFKLNLICEKEDIKIA